MLQPPNNVESICGDGIDNDKDCYVDCADLDCFNQFDPNSTSPECGCRLYQNGSKAGNKLDIAIIGEYWDVPAAGRETAFYNDVNTLITQGFARAEPFASNMSKINFWVTLINESQSESVGRQRCSQADKYIFYSLRRHEPYAEIGGKNAYVLRNDTLFTPVHTYAIHETGHMFGLWDEYVYSELPGIQQLGEWWHSGYYETANCYVPDLFSYIDLQYDCRTWFGGWVGHPWHTDCIAGCTSPGWYRSTNQSIMDGEDGKAGMFNEVCIKIVDNHLVDYVK